MSKTSSNVVNFTTGQRRLTNFGKVLKLTTLIFSILAIAAQGFATPKNLVAGVGPLNSATKWDGRTAFSVIPGASLFPTTSKTTAFYIAFTGGTQAEIGNMALYQTAARDGVITGVTPDHSEQSLKSDHQSHRSGSLSGPAGLAHSPVHHRAR